MSQFLGDLSGLGGEGSNLHAVSDDSMASILVEYDTVIKEADKLCEIIDSEKTPYLSKYKARDLLHPFRQKIEAHSVIASLDPKNKTMIKELNCKVATLRIRLGNFIHSFDFYL